MKVLQFQNRKLAERLEQRQRQEADLRQRIEQLEKRQTSDEAVLCVVNRYWNQVNVCFVLLYLNLSHSFIRFNSILLRAKQPIRITLCF